jgi:hypothetical protein
VHADRKVHYNLLVVKVHRCAGPSGSQQKQTDSRYGYASFEFWMPHWPLDEPTCTLEPGQNSSNVFSFASLYQINFVLTKWESLSSKLIFLGPNIGCIPHWILCVFAGSDSSHYKRMWFFSHKGLLLMTCVK